ncbi:INO80 complex subunit E isoform A [Alligator mississippiensis]|uniref:INO80 complex subunit E isoform A n=1 Tax=Alligator mississippiensis TaxID=8496 RepID=A0A151NVW7_ALLMI|nr:INO80 complex subunit E isoform A [Alligator mississippiensis]
MNGAAAEAEPGGHKRRYRALKRRLKLLVYEQECFQEELRKAQRRLLKVSRDKSFLLDRLLQYEHVDEESSDSEATASSDNSDGDGPKGAAEPPPLKSPHNVSLSPRKRSPQLGGASSPSSSGLSLQATTAFPLPGSGAPSPYLSSMASPPYSPFPAEYLAPEPGATRQAPDRRAKAPRKLQMASAECSVGGALGFGPGRGGGPGALPPLSASAKLPPPPVPCTVPQQMFSDTAEGSGDDPLDGDDELVIDIPE